MRFHLPLFIAASLLFLVEVLIATQFKHYHFIRAYFGDFLVVILVYCTLAAFWQFEGPPAELADNALVKVVSK